MIVIGAGLGGLCLAQGLRRAGISVAVYERDGSADLRAQGHRLHIDGLGRQALSAALPPHLFELLAAVSGRPAARVSGFDHRMRPNGVFLLDDADSTTEQMPAHTVIDREVLRRVLLTGLEDVVHFGRRCVGYESETASATARFADGSNARGSVLVAADGVGSVIRNQRLPHARVVDSRVRLIYGRVPLTPHLRSALPPELISVFNSIVGPDNRFVGIAPVEYRQAPMAAASRFAPEVVFEPVADTLAVMFGRRADRLGLSDSELRTASGERLRELVLEQLSGWHPLVTGIVESWTPATVFPITVRSSLPVPPWPTSNVTLLGDAIHAMSPAAGAGANVALRDAAALTAALTEVTGGRPLRDALCDYERAMLDEGFRMVRRSAANGARTMGANPLPS
ncbi:FAD-dependent oxidoreductase [Nocardia crassostreae]|uniref:FAD-dependent oxidoreductase n=1 Tax=Nocardia crassostreae TaxID=53428 RepID=UPI000834528B|nr:NAD(P)/FAD-dependent oxidoreductase [Nocardia crassostreae]